MSSHKVYDYVLLALLGSQDLVDSWWVSPNKYFCDDTPISVWETSPSEVEEYIRSFCG